MNLPLKAYGETAILAHDLSESQRASLCDALRLGMPDACIEYVMGDDTVLFIFKVPVPISHLSHWLEPIQEGKVSRAKSKLRLVPVTYDGPDLESVAGQVGLSVAEVIEIHSAATYTVRMMGFAPGFPYLDGLDPRLHLSRKESPRERIEPGSVAIGGSHAGIYSVASPGGWHLLGRTNVRLFDPDAAKSARPNPQKVFLLSPGDRLKFKALS